MLFATDLDRTIIHSAKFIENPDQVKCVELLNGKEISYMTLEAIQLLEKVKKTAGLYMIPITTRSLAQFKRIETVQDLPYAVVANGGIILHKGQELKQWKEHVRSICQELKNQYQNIEDLLERYNAYLTREPSLIDDIFFFTKIEDNKETIAYIDQMMSEELEGTAWTFTIQGLKLYIIPKEISKGKALEFLSHHLNERHIITAGDGKLDQTFLPLGKIRCIPKDSEVYYLLSDREGYTVVSSGMTGAEETLELVLKEARLEDRL